MKTSFIALAATSALALVTSIANAEDVYTVPTEQYGMYTGGNYAAMPPVTVY